MLRIRCEGVFFLGVGYNILFLESLSGGLILGARNVHLSMPSYLVTQIYMAERNPGSDTRQMEFRYETFRSVKAFGSLESLNNWNALF